MIKRNTMTAINVAVILVVLGILALAVTNAYATVATPEGETGLKIDLGEPVAWAIGALGTLATGLVASIVGILPGPARWAAKLLQIDQVLNSVIRSWISQNAEKVASKANWTVDLRNQAVRDMAGMALNTGNKFVVQARATLFDKLHTRLQQYIEKEYGNKTG